MFQFSGWCPSIVQRDEELLRLASQSIPSARKSGTIDRGAYLNFSPRRFPNFHTWMWQLSLRLSVYEWNSWHRAMQYIYIYIYICKEDVIIKSTQSHPGQWYLITWHHRLQRGLWSLQHSKAQPFEAKPSPDVKKNYLKKKQAKQVKKYETNKTNRSTTWKDTTTFSRGSVATGASGRQAPRTGIQHRLLKRPAHRSSERLRVNVPTVAEPL